MMKNYIKNNGVKLQGDNVSPPRAVQVCPSGSPHRCLPFLLVLPYDKHLRTIPSHTVVSLSRASLVPSKATSGLPIFGVKAN